MVRCGHLRHHGSCWYVPLSSSALWDCFDMLRVSPFASLLMGFSRNWYDGTSRPSPRHDSLIDLRERSLVVLPSAFPVISTVRVRATRWPTKPPPVPFPSPAVRMEDCPTNYPTPGVHFRLRARAFVISDGTKRVAFVSTDSCMIFTSVKREVVLALQKKYGNMYSQDNVCHTTAHPFRETSFVFVMLVD